MEVLYPIRKNGKYGYINNKGSVIIDCVFDSAAPFSEGMARIEIGNLCGFINEKGNVIIPPKFKYASSFSDGLAAVQIDEKWGYIDIQGNYVISPQFYSAYGFIDGVAKVQNSKIPLKEVFIDKTGKVIADGHNFLISEYNDGLINSPNGKGRWGFIDISNQFKIQPIYLGAYPFNEKKAAVEYRRDTYGFIDTDGNEVIPCKFKGADIKFSEDRCAVWNQHNGYIDAQGNLVIPHQFYFAGHFSEGLAVIKLSRHQKYGYIDKNGNVVIEPIFQSAENFKNGLALVIIGKEYEDFRYGYINKTGDYIWEPTI